MKKIGSLLLLIGYSIALLQFYLPFVTYKVNKNFIATVLCENRAKANMHCNGKCFLKKELQKSAKEHSSKNGNLTNDFVELIAVSTKHEMLLKPSVTTLQSNFTAFIFSYAHSHSGSVFHPPLLG